MHTPNPTPEPGPWVPNRLHLGKTADQMVGISSKLINLAQRDKLNPDSGVIVERVDDTTVLRFPPMLGEYPATGPYISLKDKEHFDTHSYDHGHGGHHDHDAIESQSVWMTDGVLDDPGDETRKISGLMKNQQFIVRAGSKIALESGARKKFKFVGHQITGRDKSKEEHSYHSRLEGTVPKISSGFANPRVPVEKPAPAIRLIDGDPALTKGVTTARREAARITWQAYKSVRRARREILDERARRQEDRQSRRFWRRH